VVMEGSCTFSGPSGNLSFRWFQETHEDIDAHFSASFSQISVLQIREFRNGRRTTYGSSNKHTSWKQNAVVLHCGAFEELTDVEGLTIVCCKMEPFPQTLAETVDGIIHLSGLQKLTVYVGYGDMEVSALMQCKRTRKERFRPLGK